MPKDFDSLSNRRKRHYINCEADKFLEEHSKSTSSTTLKNQGVCENQRDVAPVIEHEIDLVNKTPDTDNGCTCGECNAPEVNQSLRFEDTTCENLDEFYEEDYYYYSDTETLFDLLYSDDEDDTCSDVYFTGESDDESTQINNHELSFEDTPSGVLSILGNELAKWKMMYYISLIALSALLIILRRNGHESDLPKDARTLLKTPKNSFKYINKFDNGKYGHFGIMYGIETLIKSNYDRFKTMENIVISLNIHIDGLPLIKSSSRSFCTIQASAVSPIKHSPFLIGVFYGNGKPNDSNAFLKPFVEDFKCIEDKEIVVMGLRLRINVNAVICDAPALAYVKSIKYFNGHYGCSRCTQKGISIRRRMTFSSINYTLRNDQLFRQKKQRSHHNGSSILEKLKIDMVAQFPIDYMHCACLGVMKKLLKLWIKGVSTFKLLPEDIILLSDMITGVVKHFIPEEFGRKPRSVIDIHFWKATELRQFLMYTGMVVMRLFLNSTKYNHFLKLCVAFRILCDEDLYREYNNYAESLLKQFVTKCPEYYGPEILTYNFHNLIHLPADALRFGPLDKFSAFPFENAMQKIKRNIHPNDSCLEQLLNRTIEQYKMETDCSHQTIYPMLHFSKMKKNKQLKSVGLKGFNISVGVKNNICMLKNNQIGLIEKLFEYNGTVHLHVRVLKDCHPLFRLPCDSTNLGICISNITRLQATKEIPISEIKRKMLKIPIFNKENYSKSCYEEFALIPLLHNESER